MTTSDVEVEILGDRVRPDSAGRLPGRTGVDQITFRFPEGVPDDCYIPVTVRVADRASNQITVAKAVRPGPCRHPFGLSLGQLHTLDSGGLVSISRFLIESDATKTPDSAGRYIRLDTVHLNVVNMHADGVAAVSGAHD